jgi:hypothetical protein
MTSERAKPAFSHRADGVLSDESAAVTLAEFERWRSLAGVGAPVQFPQALGVALLDLAIAELRAYRAQAALSAVVRGEARPTTVPYHVGDSLRLVSASVDALLAAATINRALERVQQASRLFGGRPHA